MRKGCEEEAWWNMWSYPSWPWEECISPTSVSRAWWKTCRVSMCWKLFFWAEDVKTWRSSFGKLSPYTPMVKVYGNHRPPKGRGHTGLKKKPIHGVPVPSTGLTLLVSCKCFFWRSLQLGLLLKMLHFFLLWLGGFKHFVFFTLEKDPAIWLAHISISFKWVVQLS